MALDNKILIAPYGRKLINHVNLKDESLYRITVDLILHLNQPNQSGDCGHYDNVLCQTNDLIIKQLCTNSVFIPTIRDKNWLRNSGRNLFPTGRFKPILAETNPANPEFTRKKVHILT